MLPQVLLIGATGRTGRLVLEEALERGHSVTALVRKPNSDLPQHPSLAIATGDPCTTADIEATLQNMKPTIPIVIISTLGQTRMSESPFAATVSPPRFMESSAQAVLAASQKLEDSSQIKKLIVMSMFGAGDSFSNLNFLMRWIMKYTNMAQTLEDQNLVDEAVKAGPLPFVLIRPAMLVGERAAPLKLYGSTGKGSGFMPSVSAKSVAGFLLDAAVKEDFDGTTPVITN